MAGTTNGDRRRAGIESDDMTDAARVTFPSRRMSDNEQELADFRLGSLQIDDPQRAGFVADSFMTPLPFAMANSSKPSAGSGRAT